MCYHETAPTASLCIRPFEGDCAERPVVPLFPRLLHIPIDFNAEIYYVCGSGNKYSLEGDGLLEGIRGLQTGRSPRSTIGQTKTAPNQNSIRMVFQKDWRTPRQFLDDVERRLILTQHSEFAVSLRGPGKSTCEYSRSYNVSFTLSVPHNHVTDGPAYGDLNRLCHCGEHGE